MASDEQRGTDKRREEYVDGLKKTLVPVVLGLLAGVIAYFVAPDPVSGDGLLIAFLMVITQRFLFPIIHTKLEGPKDWLYVSFMTLFSWFIAFTLLLNP